MQTSSPHNRRQQTLRFLTLVCFFHFAGLNNGFTFMLAQAQPMSIQSVSFAPVFVKGLCTAVNPFAWKAALNFRFIKQVLFSSSRALQISGKNTIRKLRKSHLLSVPSILAPSNTRELTPSPDSCGFRSNRPCIPVETIH